MDANVTTLSSPEILSLVLGGVGMLVVMWVRDRIQDAVNRTDRVERRQEEQQAEADDENNDWHAFAKSLAASIATVVAELKHHGERIAKLETDTEGARDERQSITRTVLLNGEQTRVAIERMSSLETAVIELTKSNVRMGVLMEQQERRTTEKAVAIEATRVEIATVRETTDRLYHLLTRATSRAPAAAR